MVNFPKGIPGRIAKDSLVEFHDSFLKNFSDGSYGGDTDRTPGRLTEGATSEGFLERKTILVDFSKKKKKSWRIPRRYL